MRCVVAYQGDALLCSEQPFPPRVTPVFQRIPRTLVRVPPNAPPSQHMIHAVIARGERLRCVDRAMVEGPTPDDRVELRDERGLWGRFSLHYLCLELLHVPLYGFLTRSDECSEP